MNSQDTHNDARAKKLLTAIELSDEENDALLKRDQEYYEKIKLSEEILEREDYEGIVQQPYIKPEEDEVVDSFDHLFPTLEEIRNEESSLQDSNGYYNDREL